MSQLRMLGTMLFILDSNLYNEIINLMRLYLFNSTETKRHLFVVWSKPNINFTETSLGDSVGDTVFTDHVIDDTRLHIDQKNIIDGFAGH